MLIFSAPGLPLSLQVNNSGIALAKAPCGKSQQVYAL